MSAGSSPLARGLHRGEGRQQAALGIIPARAGFTDEVGVDGRHVQDHPRSRGVYCCGTAAASSWVGSSPLARGLPEQVSARGRDSGIIPARAGFTVAVVRPAAPRRDHPRSRGVYPTPPFWLATAMRIIPARAGFTVIGSNRTSVSGDHPRSRGVYGHRTCRSRAPAGSSPLARGLRIWFSMR